MNAARGPALGHDEAKITVNRGCLSEDEPAIRQASRRAVDQGRSNLSAPDGLALNEPVRCVGVDLAPTCPAEDHQRMLP
jgi:hypothetical protein